MILIIDRQTDLNSPLVRFLEKVGYRVQVIDNIKDAVGFIEAVRPGLIIVDEMNEYMSGLGLVRQLKMQARFSEIPVLVYTHLDDPKLRETVAKLGAGQFIVKGELALVEMLERINQLYKETVSPTEPELKLVVQEESQEEVKDGVLRRWGGSRKERVERVVAESQAHMLRANALVGESRRLVSLTPLARKVGDRILGLAEG